MKYAVPKFSFKFSTLTIPQMLLKVTRNLCDEFHIFWNGITYENIRLAFMFIHQLSFLINHKARHLLTRFYFLKLRCIVYS